MWHSIHEQYQISTLHFTFVLLFSWVNWSNVGWTKLAKLQNKFESWPFQLIEFDILTAVLPSPTHSDLSKPGCSSRCRFYMFEVLDWRFVLMRHNQKGKAEKVQNNTPPQSAWPCKVLLFHSLSFEPFALCRLFVFDNRYVAEFAQITVHVLTCLWTQC